MKKTIIIIIVIAIVIFGGYLLLKGNQMSLLPTTMNVIPYTDRYLFKGNQTSLPSTTTIENVIQYTDNGFNPTTLNIKQGETVTFKNESSRSMWTASAMHPSHKDYPTTGGCLGSTFDACQGVQPGDSWSFKFDIVGTWKYHDHLAPKYFGAIIVE